MTAKLSFDIQLEWIKNLFRVCVLMPLRAVWQVCVKRLSFCPKSFINTHPSIPFSSLQRMRDRISHHYEGISEDVVFEIAKSDIPDVLRQIKAISWD